MKRSQRIFSVFLVFVLLSGVFSLNVSAGFFSYNLYQEHIFNNQYFGGLLFSNNNENIEKLETAKTYVNSVPTGLYTNRIRITNRDNSTLAPKGRACLITLENLYFSVLYNVKGTTNGTTINQTAYIVKPDRLRVTVKYVDGSTTELKDDYVQWDTRKDKIINVMVDFVPEKAVQEVFFKLETDLASKIPYANTPDYTYNLTFYSGEYDGDDKYQVLVAIQSEEAGLLGTIVSWIEDIYNGIVNLPSKLWGLISDGLKSLFVPSDEYIIEFKEECDALLSNKLGAVYQVSNAIFDTFDGIRQSTETHTIHFPEVSINFSDSNSFSFGGWDIKVVPDGFEFLVDTVKLLVGISATVLFINGLRKRYDDVLGG